MRFHQLADDALLQAKDFVGVLALMTSAKLVVQAGQLFKAPRYGMRGLSGKSCRFDQTSYLGELQTKCFRHALLRILILVKSPSYPDGRQRNRPIVVEGGNRAVS